MQNLYLFLLITSSFGVKVHVKQILFPGLDVIY